MKGGMAALCFAAALGSTAMGQVIEKINYGGWPNCYRLSNGEAELIVTSDVGPRIIRYGFVGGQNLFKEYKEQMGKSGEPEWRIRGGHRLWVAPEVAQNVSPVTYAVDNFPVKIEITATGLLATPPLEKEAGLQKQMEVRLAPSGTSAQVSHRITNRNLWAIELSPWVLTVMAQGGVGLTGLPPRGTHPEVLPPTNPLVIWAFTDLGDPRWIFLKKYVGLRQDPKNSVPQKIGHFNSETWGAYYLNGELFVKRYAAYPGRTYADMGCSFEMFTNGDMLELETLGPLTRLEPGQTVEHVETWSLHRGVKIERFDDASLDRALKPLLE